MRQPESARRFKQVWVVVLLLLNFFAAIPTMAQTLRVGDLVEVTIVESQSASGAFTVGDDGALSLPGFGLIPAAGRDLRSFEEDLRRIVGSILMEPSVAVQLLTERLVYVTGSVSSPGAYSYRDGLRAIQLIALAGGTRRDRLEDGDDWSIAVTGVRAEQGVAEAANTLMALRVRIDRLEAEISGAAEWPDSEIESRLPGVSSEVIAREQALFKARAEQLAARINISEEVRVARAAELVAHNARIAEDLGNVAEIEEQAASLRVLQDRGLATAERVNTQIREASRARSNLLQSEILRDQTRAALSELDERIASAINSFRVEAQQELRDARLGVTALEVEQITQQEIVDITGSSRLGMGARGQSFTLQVLRAGAEAGEPADALTLLGVDDVLIVSRGGRDLDLIPSGVPLQ